MKKIFLIALLFVAARGFSQINPPIYPNGLSVDGQFSLSYTVPVKPVTYPADSTRSWFVTTLDSGIIYKWNIVTRIWEKLGAGNNAIPQVNSDWNANNGTAQILNKPTIPTDNTQIGNGRNFIPLTALSVLKSPLSYSNQTGVFDFDSLHWHSKGFYDGIYQPLGSYQLAGNYQPLENQRVGTTNLPSFTGVNVLPQTNLTTPATGFNITDSTGAGVTFIFPSSIRKSLYFGRATQNRLWSFMDRSYIVADSADVAANTILLGTHTTQIASKVNKTDSTLATGYVTPTKYNQLQSNTATNIIGNYIPDGQLWIWGMDSKTEIGLGGTGWGGDWLTSYRQSGNKLQNLAGVINMGGSGYTLQNWLNDAAGTIPTYTNANLGTGQNDYYGHKASGAISLATSLAWRNGKSAKATWFIDGGTNDCMMNSLGQQSVSTIASTLTSYLIAGIQKIQAAYPQDKIVLRMPSPMVARPLGAGFPSNTYYPTFGQNLSTDSLLVDNWNQGIRQAYLQAAQALPGTILFDSWNLCFGYYPTSYTGGTQLPWKTDMVHENGNGYIPEMKAIVDLLIPSYSTTSVPTSTTSRREIADMAATALGNNAWDNYPSYFRNNPRYKKVVDNALLVTASSNVLVFSIPYNNFVQQVSGATNTGFYVVVGDRAAQYFSYYIPSNSAGNTAITSVSPSALIQSLNGANQKIEIYQDNIYIKSYVRNDSYIDSAVNVNTVAREYYTGTVSGGNGYMDIQFDNVQGRLSTYWLQGVLNGTMVIGGTARTQIAMSSANSIGLTGNVTGRTARIFIAGNYPYSGQPFAIYFGDGSLLPKAYEVSAGSYTWPAVQSHVQTLGVTPADAEVIAAGTVATSAVPVQISPAIRWQGYAYNTTASSYNYHNIRNYYIPINGATTTGYLGWFGANNSASYTELMRLYIDGRLQLDNKLTHYASTALGASGNIPIGVAPTSPVEGDYWTYNHHYYMYLNNTPVQLDGQSGASGFDSLRNNGGVLEGRKNGTFVPQFTLPTSGVSSAPSIPANSLPANTTNITATPSNSVAFQYVPSTNYTGTVTFDAASTAASTANYLTYSWQRIGNMVTVIFRFNWQNASTSDCLDVYWGLPTDCPTPKTYSDVTADFNVHSPGVALYGNVSGNNSSTSLSDVQEFYLRKRSAQSSGYEAVMYFKNGASVNHIWATLTYESN